MSLQCCNSCGTVQTVNVPGSEGTAGVDGTDGLNAFSHTTTLTFPLPGDGNPVDVDVDSSAWMVLGQIVVVGIGVDGLGGTGPQHFTVTALPSATQVTLTQTDVAGDVQTGDITAGAVVSPSAV